MPSRSPSARIAIALPGNDLASADRLARRHDRSRSWIVAEAIRRFVAADDAANASARVLQQPNAASAAAAVPTQPRLGDSRRAQLISDLSLTPEARVRAAEETLRLSELQSTSGTHRIASDEYEDFLDWKRRRDIQW